MEPKLCEDCPLASLVRNVRSRIYTTGPTEERNVNVCSKLKALATKWGWPQCGHFPPNENITRYFSAQASFGPTSEPRSGKKRRKSSKENSAEQ